MSGRAAPERLAVIGRCRDVVKLASGEFVSPVAVEAALLRGLEENNASRRPIIPRRRRRKGSAAAAMGGAAAWRRSSWTRVPARLGSQPPWFPRQRQRGWRKRKRPQRMDRRRQRMDRPKVKAPPSAAPESDPRGGADRRPAHGARSLRCGARPRCGVRNVGHDDDDDDDGDDDCDGDGDDDTGGRWAGGRQAEARRAAWAGGRHLRAAAGRARRGRGC